MTVVFPVKMKELYRPIFLYEYVQYGRPSPYDSEFCDELVKEYISVVKIEMATESVTVSRKERRVSFENQISSLGKCIPVVSKHLHLMVGNIHDRGSKKREKSNRGS